MAKQATTELEQPITYKINFPQRRWWDKENGEWQPVPLYSPPPWVKYHETLRIMEGQGHTEDIAVALDMIDMGAEVTPDPRPLWQETYAQTLQAEAGGNMSRLQELAKYVNETNEWRAKHNLKPLTVIAPDVPRGISALLTAVQQQG